MRTELSNGIAINYANEIGFAFMPCIIKVSGSGVTSIELEISCDGMEFVCAADAFKNGCILDYREYIQSIFDSDSKGNIDYMLDYEFDNLGKTVSFVVHVYAGDVEKKSFSFESFYVWGAMQFGETWGGYKRLTWFRNFPFSFGLYADAATKILIGFNGSPQKYISIAGKGMFNVMAQNFDKEAKYSIIYRYDGEIKQATFENVFDLTFYLSAGEQKELLRIDFDDTEEGIYLRWIDRHGFYRYWLFTLGEQSRDITSEGEFMRNNLFAYSDIVGYMGTFGRNQRYQRKDVLTLCAPSVDSDTFDMLQDLASSPVVDMYMGGDANEGEDRWQSVTVKAGSYSKTGATLQDFICQLEINNINIQSL